MLHLQPCAPQLTVLIALLPLPGESLFWLPAIVTAGDAQQGGDILSRVDAKPAVCLLRWRMLTLMNGRLSWVMLAHFDGFARRRITLGNGAAGVANGNLPRSLKTSLGRDPTSPDKAVKRVYTYRNKSGGLVATRTRRLPALGKARSERCLKMISSFMSRPR